MLDKDCIRVLKDDAGVLMELEIKVEVEADDVVAGDEVRTDISDAKDWIDGENFCPFESSKVSPITVITDPVVDWIVDRVVGQWDNDVDELESVIIASVSVAVAVNVDIGS